MKRWKSVLALACLPLAGCPGWKDIEADDPNLGASLRIEGDPAAPRVIRPKDWPTCVVVRNLGHYGKIAFRAANGTTQYYDKQSVPMGGLVALHVGPEDVEFMFYWRGDNGDKPAPQLVERLNPCNLDEKYPGILEP